METRKTYEYDIQILERHLDSFGHVNNAVYLELYEEARWDMLTRNGHGLNHVLKSKIAPIIIDLQVNYKKEIKNREKIRIETRYGGEKNRLVMYIDQKMVNEFGKTVSTIKLTTAVMDLEQRKLITPSDEWRKAFGA